MFDIYPSKVPRTCGMLNVPKAWTNFNLIRYEIYFGHTLGIFPFFDNKQFWDVATIRKTKIVSQSAVNYFN